ncbi:MAG TPA: hypothetical protein PLV92_29215, partial [Pirellulaceae bacterium]|nr:hypothetical protein [Pirellulaceae bacterium]
VNPQSFQWEQLRPPLSVESFAQLRARLRFLPPSYLRPRRATEGLFCVDVAACEAATFDAARQQLEATLRDRDGESARLVQPYFDRAADGFGAFAQALSESGGKLRFVCGHAKLDGRGLVIRPVAAVLDDDGRRTGLCPWFSRGLANVSTVGASPVESVGDKGNSNRQNVCAEFIAEWQAKLGDLLVTGLMRASRDSFEAVRRLEDRAARLGFVRVAHALRELRGELDRRDRDLRWDAARASALVAHHCLLVKVAVEE